MNNDNSKPKLLLHVCCGPCSTTALERLMKKYDITAFWFNPNIYPAYEQEKRKEVFLSFAKELGVSVITIEGEEFDNGWLEYIKGLENEPECGKRCLKCFEFRLKKSKDLAKKIGIKLIATTLTVSPFKNTADVFQVENKIGGKETAFLQIDFKDDDGYKRSIILSKQHKLYRQRYCGCKFSLR